MKIVKMVLQIAVLYLFYIIGTMIQQYFHLFIPGSVLGMLLLFALLMLNIFPEKWIQTGANTLLFYLPLFFIPATVGVIEHLDLFAGKGLWLILIVVMSTLVTIGITGFVAQWFISLADRSKSNVQSPTTIPEHQLIYESRDQHK
ncbi:CidA/LrgA family protein [Paenibacillus nicotianae]|uniref:CidA/LrgA family protein n=1 Tax=Paenibacillus nicotianae TaxID=1526551 RepID=A0ABW4UTJ2_9BACL